MSNTQTSDVNENLCSVCNEGLLPIEQTFSCVSNDYLTSKYIMNSDTLIDNCVKYNDIGKCGGCADSFFLKSDNSGCVSECPKKVYDTIVVDKNAGNNYYTKYLKQCVYAADGDSFEAGETGGQMRAPNLEDLDEQIIITCASDYFPTVGLTLAEKDRTNVNPQGSIWNFVNSPKDVHPKVTCVATAGKTVTLSNDCSYYFKQADNEYGCIRCGMGKSALPTDKKYLGTCSSMADCDSGVEYGNLSAYWSKLVSCHKCSGTTTKIPFIVYEGTAVDDPAFKTFKKWNIGVKHWTDNPTAETSNMVCLTNTVSGLNTELSLGADAQAVVSNCGLGFLNLAYSNAFNSSEIASAGPDFTDKQAILCIACLPGKTATPLAADTTNFVSACSADDITNCTTAAGKEWFNACSQCNSGSVYEYDNTNGIQYDSCVTHADANCYAKNSNTDYCELCVKGYSLNQDKVCEKLQSPKCETDKFYLDVALDKVADNSYLVYATEYTTGCPKCISGYTSVINSNDTKLKGQVCVTSAHINQYKSSSTGFPDIKTSTPSEFIDQCNKYDNNQADPTCHECNPNFVIRENGSECLSSSSLSNCVTAENSLTKCKVCQANYGLLSATKTCSSGSIGNCMEYNTDTAQSVVTCTKCNTGFYLDSNSCKAGEVANCLEHSNSKKRCNVCDTGYMLIQHASLDGDRDYCIKNDASLNCSAATLTNNALGGNYECTACTNLYGKLNTPTGEDLMTVCLQYSLIDNCDTYDVESTLSTTNFLCTKCKSGFYVTNDGTTCTARVNKPSACVLYNDTKDECATCNSGFYLDSGNTKCTANPVGIIGCRTYTSINTCTNCDQDRYLEGNECK